MKGTVIFFLLCILVFFIPQISCQNAGSPKISYTENSEEWHIRNRHLIPDKEEMEAILNLDQDGDGIRNGDDSDIDNDGIKNINDKDIDGDGIKNNFDPSPYDWREIGYNPFGVLAFFSWNHTWNNFKYNEENLKRAVKLLQDMGARFVRMDFLWNDIEPQQGNFDFDKYDFIVNLLSQHQIRILGILVYSADWASDSWNNPPYRDEDFVTYCKEVVARYKTKIKYWEVWNEPDSIFYWRPQDDMQRYTQLLKKVYETVKEIDPSSKIILGGLTQNGYFALKNLYRNGAGGYFDIVNIHPFVNPLEKNSVNRIRSLYKNIKNLMKKYGDEDKKIWFTEIGCPGVKKTTEENTWWEGVSPNEGEQAKFVKTVYKEVISLDDVEKLFWAFFRDNKDHFRSGVDYFGLVRWDFSKKPSFNAYRRARLNWRRNQLKKLYQR